MKWIIDDLLAALAELKRAETWIVLGTLAAFALLAWLVFQFAIRTDSVVRFLRNTVTACREMTNGPIIFLFCGMIFFIFSAVLTFGEMQRFFHYRDVGATFQATSALRGGILWGAIAVTIAVAALIFFNSYCL
jgi:hypothetical protein